jgi:hypothetical protein
VSSEELGRRIGELKKSLSMIEVELARGELSGESLEHFKGTVDNVRTSLLAVLTAAHSDNYTAFIGRFRVRRAVQICQNVLADVIDGHLPGEAPELSAAESTIAQAADRVAALCSA